MQKVIQERFSFFPRQVLAIKGFIFVKQILMYRTGNSDRAHEPGNYFVNDIPILFAFLTPITAEIQGMRRNNVFRIINRK